MIEGRILVSVDEELKSYYEKFPQVQTRDAFKSCKQCQDSIARIRLKIDYVCEGCRFSVLKGPAGLFFYVAIIHVETTRDLYLHRNQDDCLRIVKMMGGV